MGEKYAPASFFRKYSMLPIVSCLWADGTEANSTAKSWKAPLPQNRHGNLTVEEPYITHEKYFTHIHTLLEKDDFHLVRTAVLACGGTAEVLQTIDIQLQKHGAFYHPARICVTTPKNKSFLFAANIAFSTAGLRQIEEEFLAFSVLQKTAGAKHLPKLYGMGETTLPNAQPFKLFLVDWLSSFYEFHITQNPITQPFSVGVWESPSSQFLLSEPEKKNLYFQCAHILTDLLDLHRLWEVFPWHHAAGDFVVRKNETGIAVKLITVRRYGPLFGTSADSLSPQEIFEGLICYIQTLAIKMGLDRYDGIQEMVFFGDEILPEVISGIMTSLMTKQFSFHDAPAAMLLQAYLFLAENKWKQVTQTVLQRLSAADQEVLQKEANLNAFFETLYLECLKWETPNI